MKAAMLLAGLFIIGVILMAVNAPEVTISIPPLFGVGLAFVLIVVLIAVKGRGFLGA